MCLCQPRDKRLTPDGRRTSEIRAEARYKTSARCERQSEPAGRLSQPRESHRPGWSRALPALGSTWLLLRHRRRLPRFWRRLAQRADWPLPVHLISLARLPAKRTSALQRAAEAGLTDVSVCDAVDGRELSPEELQRRGVSTYAGWRLAGSYFLVRGQG